MWQVNGVPFDARRKPGGAVVRLPPDRFFSRATRAQQFARRGFTLLEILIVLGLVVIISGLALTTLQKPIAGRRLQLAADQIRAEWARARNRAMATGQIYCFVFELGSRGYSIQPWSDEEADSLQGAESDQSLPPLDFGVSANPIGGSGINSGIATLGRKELPERISFAGLEVSDVDTSAAFSQSVSGLGSPFATTGWDSMTSMAGASSGTTIFFFPDGTTSSALLTLENEFGRRIDISLRGLTGAVLVGDPYNGAHGESVILSGQ